MSDLIELVEEWDSLDRGSNDLYELLKAMAADIEFSINCIEDLRKEIETKRSK